MEKEFRFRDLRADEIEVRIGEAKRTYFTLLLYKNARVDMDILDETVGAMNWQRKHSRENANCAVGIYDESKKEWVWKEDTGTESNTEAQKGLASDSFKRACTNWGIGRELYTAPKMFINAEMKEYKTDKFKPEFLTNFYVSRISIVNKKITCLRIDAYDTREKHDIRVVSYGTISESSKRSLPDGEEQPEKPQNAPKSSNKQTEPKKAEKTANANVVKGFKDELPFPMTDTKSHSEQIADILVKQEYIDRLKKKTIYTYGTDDFDSLNDYQFKIIKSMAEDFRTKIYGV